MLKPTPSKPGLFSVACKQFRALQGIAVVVFGTLGLALAITATFVMTTTPSRAYATPPNTLNFQARLESANGAIVPDGNYNVEFKITNDPSTSDGGQGVCSGSCLWREDYLVSGSNGIRVVNGYLSVNLGSVTSFPTGMNWDQSLYLTMDIGGTNSSPSWDVEMTPRLPLTGVPYAFQSKQAESLQDAQASFTGTLSFATLTGGNQNFVVADQAAAGTYDLLAAPSGSGYTGIGVELQSSTPGTAQNGNFNVSGTGIVGSLGVGTTSIGSTVLTVQSTANDQVLIKATNSTSFIRPLEVLDPNMVSGNNIVLHMGHDLSNYDSGYFGFNYQGANSTSNFVTLGLYGNDNILNITGAGKIGIGTTSPNNALTVIGTYDIEDATTPTKGYRFRTSGSALDFEGSGADLYLSAWSGAGFTGTQYDQFIFSHAGGDIKASRGIYAATNNTYNLGSSTNAWATTYSTNVDVNGIDALTSGGVLSIGTTNASSINLNQNTAVATNKSFTANGSAVFKDATNSTSAFQVQNNNADQVLNVSTTQSSLVANPSFESGTTNWSASGGSTLSQNTTSSNVYYGTSSLAVALAASGTSGATTSTYTTTLSAGTYSLSFEAKGSAALAGLAASLGSGTCTLNSTSVSTSYAYYYCQNVTTTGAPVITITSTTNSATLYIDAVELDQATTPSSYRAGTANVEGSLVVNGTQVQAASSAFAMTVNELENQQGAGGGLLIQGNSDNLYQNALVVATKGGTDLLTVNTTVSSTTITGGSSFWNTPALQVSGADAAAPAAIFEGASGQTANILEVCSYSASNGCGSILANFDASGNLDIGGTPSSGTPRLYLQQSSDTSLGGIYLANSARNGGLYLWDDSSQVGYLSSGQTGSKTLDINNGGGAVGIGTSSPGSRLTVAWQSGDSNPTSYFGSNNSSNNQTAVYAENNGGSTGSCVSPSIGNENCPAVYGVSATGDGVRGVTTTTSNTQPAGGVEGLATGTGAAGIGVYGYSSQGIGVEGSSVAGISGFFQANASTNSSATLATRQNGSGTADLFQAQNSSGNSLFKITSGGLVGVGVSSPAVTLDVGGVIQQTGMSTPSSSGSNGWAELGYCTITNQYQRCETVINILGGNDGAQSYNTQATVSFRVKQQALMGSAPYVNVTLNGTAEIIKVSDFEAITTSNTCTNSPTCSTGNTTVQLWGHIEDTYEDWHYTPTLNIPDYTIAGVVWTPNNNGTGSLTATGSLPAGTVTTAIYGDSFANTLTVQDSSNTANSFQVQNSSGTSLFNVNASANTVTLLQKAQVSTYSDACGTNSLLEVADNISSPTDAVRWRSNACGANLESAGVDMYLSGWTGANFSGTQYFYLRGVENTAAGLVPGNLYIGDGFGTGGPGGGTTSLVLDEGSSDPGTEVDGGMYYNTSTKSFMCGQNGAWSDCTGLVASTTTTSGPKGTGGTSEVSFGQTWTAPQNDCQPGVVYHIYAGGYAPNAGTSPQNLNFYLQDGSTNLASTSLDVGTNSQWVADIYITCHSTTSVYISGVFSSQYSGTNVGGNMNVFNNNGGATIANGAGGDAYGLAIKWTSSPGTGSNGAYETQYIVQRFGAP